MWTTWIAAQQSFQCSDQCTYTEKEKTNTIFSYFKPIYSPEKKPHNLTPTHFSGKLLHHHHSYDIIMVLLLFSIGNRNQPIINTVHTPVSWFNKTVCHIQLKGTRVLKSCLVQEGQPLVHNKMRSNFKKLTSMILFWNALLILFSIYNLTFGNTGCKKHHVPPGLTASFSLFALVPTSAWAQVSPAQH